MVATTLATTVATTVAGSALVLDGDTRVWRGDKLAGEAELAEGDEPR